MCPHCEKVIDDNKIGYVWYERDDRKSCTVSIALHSHYQGKGYGVWALVMSMADLPGHDVSMVFANVRVDNENSLRFFDKCGFEELYNPDKYDDVMNEGIVRLRKYI
jgi:ribosomal protein S18 acetylase RimI-like enzyme